MFRRIAIIILFFLPLYLAAQPDAVFETTHGGGNNDLCYSVVPVANGFLLGGYTFSAGAGGSDMYLVKTDQNGDAVWEQTYGGDQADVCQMLLTIDNEGYILAGYSNSFGDENLDFYLVKVDENGEVIWQHTYGTENRDSCLAVSPTDDGGFILGGNTVVPGQPGTNILIVKVDEEGNEEWSDQYGGRQQDVCRSIYQTEDGGFIIGGTTRSMGAGRADFYLLKLDENGDIEWEESYGGGSYDKCTAMIIDSDGNYILTGGTYSFGAGRYDAYVAKVDPDGELLWDETFGGGRQEIAYSIIETEDGGYAIGGYTDSFGAGENDFFLVIIDADGENPVHAAYGSEEDDEVCHSLIQNEDGGFTLAGYIGSEQRRTQDVYLVKTDDGGEPEQYYIRYYLFFQPYVPGVGLIDPIQISVQGERVAEGEVYVIPDYNIIDYGLGESFQVYMDAFEGTEVKIETGALSEDVELHLVLSNLILSGPLGGEEPVELVGIYSPHVRLDELLWAYQDYQIWEEGPDSSQLNDDDHYYFQNSKTMEVTVPLDEEFWAMMESLHLDYDRLGAALWGGIWRHRGIRDLHVQIQGNPWFQIHLTHLSHVAFGPENGFFDGLAGEYVEGWSLISYNVDPASHVLDDIFDRQLMNGTLLMMKNQAGDFWALEYGFSMIESFEINEGYLVKMSEDNDYEVLGQQIDSDTPIPLEEGWSIAPFYPEQPVPVLNAFANIRDRLIIAKDYLGNFYAPVWNDFNNMDPPEPGKAYQVKMEDEVDFVWGIDDVMASQPERNLRPTPVHFQSVALTGANMSLLISGVPKNMKGGELGVFNQDGLCAGAVVLSQNGMNGAAIWGDDISTPEIDGAIEGDELIFKLWNGSTEMEIEPAWLQGDGIYERDGFAVMEIKENRSTPVEFSLEQPYPNPFNSSVRLRFAIGVKSDVSLTIYDASGRAAAVEFMPDLTAGRHTYTYRAAGLSSGVYFARLKTDQGSKTVKMALIR